MTWPKVAVWYCPFVNGGLLILTIPIWDLDRVICCMLSLLPAARRGRDNHWPYAATPGKVTLHASACTEFHQDVQGHLMEVYWSIAVTISNTHVHGSPEWKNRITFSTICQILTFASPIVITSILSKLQQKHKLHQPYGKHTIGGYNVYALYHRISNKTLHRNSESIKLQ
ncbi:hypothetical protein BDZ91DRAFT_823915 [Kalaharituber pfeilii]|nr:hypothetical protein BDZ91DRAFT_823915 [Kalaharituber pfeilii]